MPKKKPAKGKKGKGGKAKTESKHEPKADKESDMERAKANAALWELRLDVTERSRVEYREAAHRLARVNENLTNQQYRAEKDMIDIISLLRTKETETDEKIRSLEEQLEGQKARAREERESLVGKYTLRINELEDRFKKRSNDFDMIQVELKNIKEFHKRKAQMELELSNIKESMNLAEKNHMENLGRVETKFFTEKVRLEKEAEQRLAQLAESAYDEAIVKLDDAARSVFKENVRLNEALNLHMKEEENLKKMAASLAEKNAFITMDNGTYKLMIKKNLAQIKAYREELSDLKAKLGSLEQEKRQAHEKVLISSRASQENLQTLQNLLSAREREIARIKRLAGSVVEQRTELEQFFHAALFQVKQEIQASRLVYKEQAAKAFRVRMSEARAGKQPYPLIRTFQKNPNSTNCVYSDMEEAQKWTQVQSNQVDIADLTWEQKEKVLRQLFARMNRQKTRKPNRATPLSASVEKSQMDSAAAAGTTEAVSQMTFMTQMPVSTLPSNPNSLPDIHMT